MNTGIARSKKQSDSKPLGQAVLQVYLHLLAANMKHRTVPGNRTDVTLFTVITEYVSAL